MHICYFKKLLLWNEYSNNHKSRRNSITNSHVSFMQLQQLSTNGHWRRKGQPTPVLSPGESHGQRSLAGYSPRDRRVEHDCRTNFHFQSLIHCISTTSIKINLKKMANLVLSYPLCLLLPTFFLAPLNYFKVNPKQYIILFINTAVCISKT